MKKVLPSKVPIRCSYTRLAEIKTLKPNPKNPNQHPKAQLELLGNVIAHQGWRRAPVVSRRSGLLVTGHGSVQAARLKGWKVVPVDEQDFESAEDETAHMIADNRLPELSEIDGAILEELILDLKQDGFDIDLTGFDAASLGSGEAFEEAPDSIAANLAELNEIKSQRKKGNAGIIAKTDTEYYVVVMFPNRKDKDALLKRLGLPADERYVAAESLRIEKRMGNRLNLGKAAPANRAGATG